MTIRRAIKWVLALLLYHTGLLRVFKKWSPKDILILVFHRVTPEPVDDGMTVSEAVFDAQVQYIHRSYEVVSLDRAADILKGIHAVEAPTLVISFDDGY